MEHIKCHLCGGARSRLLFTRKDLVYKISEEEFNVVKCLDCGLVYVNPRPSESEIHSFYTDDYYCVDISKEALLKAKEDTLLAKFDKVKHIPPGRLLDIGCQKGEFLFFMQQKGWEVKGIDFSDAPPNLFGLDIFYGKLEEADFSPGSFDLITLWAVLEHVYYPREMLSEAHRLLKPGGKIVLLVTNIYSIPGRFMRHDDIPRHTTMFSKSTIKKMLKLTGFKVDKYYFGSDIFSGSTRGVFNYLIKLLAGEDINDIVEQNRSLDWWDFSCTLNRRDSQLMRRIDRIDNAITPYLDRVMDILGYGFIMTIEATKSN